ncbi:MAG TPA: AmmeMemoRadiSam system protein B [Candidatus Magasanikbacteria bacterium]|nr:MAG: AmmeMemoRadiSam system protein B [Candidatus Magasanikbacteria bacterium RIFOXYC2_FULL_39_8]HAT03959.1 AmmeMemoRadiSam system protein B [Candidatus Magasanikbacteria bacterium]
MSYIKNILLVVSLVLVSGCTTGGDISGTSLASLEGSRENTPYQYSAPWDKVLYEGFYTRMQGPNNPNSTGEIKGGVVPHHLLAGHMAAAFFDNLAPQNPSTIIIIGPNHFGRGVADVISTLRDWKTPFGDVETDTSLVEKLVSNNIVVVDEETIKEEHSLYSTIPFIRHSLPNAKVVPLALRNDIATEKMDELIAILAQEMPKDAVIISSIDFSHYQTLPVANFHDELSMGVIKSFDYDRLEDLEIDSVPSLYVLMKLMEHFKAQHISYEEHSNSAIVADTPDEKLTTSYYIPYFTYGDPTNKRVASILHFGDMMLDRNVKKRIDMYGTDHVLGQLAGEELRFFKGMDVIGANLEGPFADSRRDTTKEIAFRFDPALIPMLQKYNLSLFTIANNHTLDMGWQGFEESKKNLSDAGIEYYGHELRVTQEDSVLYKEIGGLKFGFIGVDDTILKLDVSIIKQLIEESEKNNDYTIVNIHWGAEYGVLNSNARQQYLAHEMIDAGADVIIGNHPHVVQEIEMYHDRPIFYSLGNFIFDQYFSIPTQQTIGVGLVFQDTDSLNIHIFPIEAEDSRNQLMDHEASRAFLKQLVASSRLGDYTMDNNTLHISFN